MAPHDNRGFLSGPLGAAGRSAGFFRGTKLPSRSFRSVRTSGAVTLGTAYAERTESINEHLREIFNRLECEMSAYLPDNAISELSRMAGVAQAVPEDTDCRPQLGWHSASPDAVTPHALSKTLFVAGLKGTGKLLKKFSSIESLIVPDRYPLDLWSTPGQARTLAAEKAERRSVLDHLCGTLQPREPVLRHV